MLQKKILEKYYYDNFRIIAISLDSNTDNWKKAVTNDGIENFINLHVQQKEQKDFQEKYNILALPTKLILSPTGEILWRKQGSTENLEHIILSFLKKNPSK